MNYVNKFYKKIVNNLNSKKNLLKKIKNIIITKILKFYFII